jgi:phosphoglucosamine mutase
VAEAIRQAEQSLGKHGRVVVRFSGTEPLARVMVEAASEDAVETWTNRIAGAIRAALA